MKKAVICSFAILMMFSCLASAQYGTKNYQNQDFGFSVDYPEAYKMQEIRWVNETTGATFSNDHCNITIQAMSTGLNYENIPFDDYVRIAASSEIQNFNRLTTIETFVSDYMVNGYKTWWEVNAHKDLDGASINATSTVGPIYYFAPEVGQKLSGQPVKTIMISSCSSPETQAMVKSDMEKVAKSFRYLASVKMFFKKGNHGKQYAMDNGKVFTIELPSNPTTGYNWFIDRIDEAYFKVLSSGYRPPDSNLLGAGGTSYFEIMPLRPGAGQIKLLYYRSWEGPKKAVDEYNLKILIK